MPKLAMNAVVHDPETGRTVVLHRGTEVTGRTLTLITNPDVWVNPEDAAEALAEFESSQVIEEETADAVVEPPRAGRGSGRDAWVLFAASHGVEVRDEDSREDVIAALAAAGVIAE